MSLGADLRHAREQRGWSIDELSARTKIAVSMLAAIEANHLDRLPDGFYRRAFLRAYAREVGLDPERVIDSYVAQFPDRTPAPVEDADRRRVFRWPRDFDWLSPQLQFVLLAVLGTAALLSLLYLTPRPQSNAVARNPETSRPPKEEPQATEQPAVGTGGALATAPATAGEETIGEAPLKMEVELRGPCWLGATADGHRVVYRLLNKGDHVTLQARDELLLRIGDAGNFQFTINGIPGRPLGESGQDVTLRVTPSNFRNFLQSF